jgi:oligosaccharyltransferase complex subunit beta
MHWYLSFLLFALLGAVQALSSVGGRLLVVLDEESEKSKYSKVLGDLEGKSAAPLDRKLG